MSPEGPTRATEHLPPPRRQPGLLRMDNHWPNLSRGFGPRLLRRKGGGGGGGRVLQDVLGQGWWGGGEVCPVCGLL